MAFTTPPLEKINLDQVFKQLEQYRQHLKDKSAFEIIDWAISKFDQSRIILASAFGPESQIITDHLAQHYKNPRIFTLDTGRLFQETYDVMQETMEKYKIPIEVYGPNLKDVAKLIENDGPNLFYKSVENRKKCCEIRKVFPMRNALSTVDAWISGLRQGQAETRKRVNVIEWDSQHQIFKINPMVNWDEDKVWKTVRALKIPYNKLIDYGFRSIGCAPCTRAISASDDIRSGRWWWEQDKSKECGIHQAPEYSI